MLNHFFERIPPRFHARKLAAQPVQLSAASRSIATRFCCSSCSTSLRWSVTEISSVWRAASCSESCAFSLLNPRPGRLRDCCSSALRPRGIPIRRRQLRFHLRDSILQPDDSPSSRSTCCRARFEPALLLGQPRLAPAAARPAFASNLATRLGHSLLNRLNGADLLLQFGVPSPLLLLECGFVPALGAPAAAQSAESAWPDTPACRAPAPLQAADRPAVCAPRSAPARSRRMLSTNAGLLLLALARWRSERFAVRRREIQLDGQSSPSRAPAF